MTSNNENYALTLCPVGTDLQAARQDSSQWLQAVTEQQGIGRLYEYAMGACILRGVRAEEEGLVMTAAALFAELRQDFPRLSLAEVGYAIKRGCFEKYGDVYGINAVSLYKMVQGYLAERRLADEERMQALRQREFNEKARQWLANRPSYKPSTLGK